MWNSIDLKTETYLKPLNNKMTANNPITSRGKILLIYNCSAAIDESANNKIIQIVMLTIIIGIKLDLNFVC